MMRTDKAFERPTADRLPCPLMHFIHYPADASLTCVYNPRLNWADLPER